MTANPFTSVKEEIQLTTGELMRITNTSDRCVNVVEIFIPKNPVDSEKFIILGSTTELVKKS